MGKYPKIYGPFNRFLTGPNKNKLDFNNFRDPAVMYLSDLQWTWTEKVDGTNIRVIWDGLSVSFAGRTDAAQLPRNLKVYLEATFTEEMLEQVFGDSPVTLYGEGYGAGIQKGGTYQPNQSFTLFDVFRSGRWLDRETVEEISEWLYIDIVPVVLQGDLYEAIELVGGGFTSTYGDHDFFAEGLVGSPLVPMYDAYGSPIKLKIKHVDFYGQDKLSSF